MINPKRNEPPLPISYRRQKTSGAVRDRRRGFTLVEILVVVGLVVVLGAALLPMVTGGLDNARIRSSADTLAALSLGIHNPARNVGSFHRHVGRFPRALSQLTRQIVASEMDSCNVAYTPAQLDAWEGPYVNRTIPPAGMPIPIGTVRDTMVWEGVADPASAGRVQVTLKILVSDVHLNDAQALGHYVDGFVDGAAGMIRWGAENSENLVILEYVVPGRMLDGCTI
jgi:prepilin-type N-terminal cleavage/methylation domain-containing protein